MAYRRLGRDFKLQSCKIARALASTVRDEDAGEFAAEADGTFISKSELPFLEVPASKSRSNDLVC